MKPLSIVNLQLQLGRRPLFDGLSLGLESGALTVLLGPNGCGKSTLLRTICHDIPYQGEIRLFDQPRQHWHAHALARRLVVLPQSSMLGFDFRAREVVELGRYPWRCSRDENLHRIHSSMQSLDVWSLRDAPYQQLSGGENPEEPAPGGVGPEVRRIEDAVVEPIPSVLANASHPSVVILTSTGCVGDPHGGDGTPLVFALADCLYLQRAIGAVPM